MYVLIFYLWNITGNKKHSDTYHGIIAAQEGVYCRLPIYDCGKAGEQMCIPHTIDRAEKQALAKT